MNNTLFKLLALGSAITLSSCNHNKHLNSLQVTNTYTLQSCDRETRAYFVEMQNKNHHYTGFIQSGNEEKIPETRKKFRIGSHTTIEIAKAHFDGVYRTHE